MIEGGGGEVTHQKVWMPGAKLLNQGIGGGALEEVREGWRVIGRELLLRGDDLESDHVIVKEIKRVVTSHP